ncbi:hypothetical protein DMP23_20705 [Amycolatopsis sp. A1MSW2902]
MFPPKARCLPEYQRRTVVPRFFPLVLVVVAATWSQAMRVPSRITCVSPAARRRARTWCRSGAWPASAVTAPCRYR